MINATEESDGSWLLELSNCTYRTDSDGSIKNSHNVGYRFYELTDSSGKPLASFACDKWKYDGSNECISYE